MLSHLAASLRNRLELGDGLVAALCLLGAAVLRRSDLLAGVSFLGPFDLADDLYLSAAIAGVASTRALRWSGAYAYEDWSEIGRVLGKLARGCASAALGLLGVGLVFGLDSLNLALVALYAPIYLVALSAWRLVAASWVRASLWRASSQNSFVVIGSDARARRVAERFTASWGSRNAGFLDDSPVSDDAEALGERYLGNAKELCGLVERENIDEVVIVLPRQQLGADSTVEAIDLCETLGLDVTVLSDLFDAKRARLGYHEALGAPALSFRSHRLPPQWALGVKRAMDLAGASLVLLLTLPLWVVVALAIKLDSPGPIFFVQRRSGLHGRAFPFIKFRTMDCNAERALAGLLDLNEQSGPVFKIKRDPRITRIGRLLRKFSIDELPQLINVLQGHMSLVGPRPPIPGEVNQYEPIQRRRLSVLPGLSCLWQVSGRNLLGFDDWVRLDLQYVDDWSLWLDVKILLKTIPAVISGRGAS